MFKYITYISHNRYMARYLIPRRIHVWTIYLHERWNMATWTRGNGLINIPYMDPLGTDYSLSTQSFPPVHPRKLTWIPKKWRHIWSRRYIKKSPSFLVSKLSGPFRRTGNGATLRAHAPTGTSWGSSIWVTWNDVFHEFTRWQDGARPTWRMGSQDRRKWLGSPPCISAMKFGHL